MGQGTLNILIVEDDAGDVKKIKRLLDESKLPCKYTAVSTIEDAITECSKLTYDCAIIDYLLPGQDGLKGITQLNNQFPFIAIIMLTAHGDEVVAAEAIKRGALDYLIKKNLDAGLLRKSILSATEKVLLRKRIELQEQKMEHISYRDQLTDVPNRSLFEYTTSRALDVAKQDKKKLALLLLDLDRFKVINTTLGYEAGDELLIEIAKRLQSILGKKEMLARLGSDEFIILLTPLDSTEEIGLNAQKILHILSKPFSLNSEKIKITASIGIATYPLSGETVFDLIRAADTALLQAKCNGGNNFQFYEPDFDKKIIGRYHIERALHAAIENQELFLMYQPIYSLLDNTLFGVEPLLRWKHPEFGKIPIEEIISVAEESGLIISINDWIMSETFRQCQACKLRGGAAVTLVMSLSPKQMSSTDWLTHLKKQIESYHIDPHLLIFQLLESDKLKNIPSAQAMLPLIAELGIQLFTDDTSMTRASIIMLNKLVISGLKISKLNVENIEDNLRDRELLKTLFEFAENMKFAVIVEGVETQVQIDFLKLSSEGKCPSYYVSKPLSPEEMAELLMHCEKPK